MLGSADGLQAMLPPNSIMNRQVFPCSITLSTVMMLHRREGWATRSASPRAKGHRPEDTAAALPEEDPPV